MLRPSTVTSGNEYLRASARSIARSWSGARECPYFAPSNAYRFLPGLAGFANFGLSSSGRGVAVPLRDLAAGESVPAAADVAARGPSSASIQEGVTSEGSSVSSCQDAAVNSLDSTMGPEETKVDAPS